MKKYIASILVLFLVFGCTPEQVEEVQQQFALSAMTTGQWKVTNFVKGGVNVTSDFSPYAFQFKTNLTVDAIKNGTVEATGNWAGDPNPSAPKISSAFTGANATLTLLNGTWLITKNSTTYVEATQTVGTEVRVMRLDKI